jgi:hypothetical protein
MRLEGACDLARSRVAVNRPSGCLFQCSPDSIWLCKLPVAALRSRRVSVIQLAAQANDVDYGTVRCGAGNAERCGDVDCRVHKEEDGRSNGAGECER